MKRNDIIVGLFAVLTFGVAFPSLSVSHERTVAAHQHIHAGGDAHVHTVEYGQADGHSAASGPCDHDCCAPGFLSLAAVAGIASSPRYFESERITGQQDRNVNGMTPLTIERPPKA